MARWTVLVVAALSLCCSSSDAGWSFDEGTPEELGMDPARLEEARSYAFAGGKNTQGVVVARSGTIVAEWYAEDRDETSPASSWSIAKSVTSALVGIALERGDLPSVDVPMTTYFPEWVGTEREGITLRHVLQMASGLAWVEDYDPEALDGSDIGELVTSSMPSHVALVADNEVAAPPGTVFNYSSGDTMLLSRVIAEATGMSVAEYADIHLFGPLGLEARWFRDQSGDTLTYCCLDMPTRDFAVFGQLYLEGGTLDDQAIVPADWVRASLESSPSYEGYGYKWWLIGRTETGIPEDTVAAIGHNGQYIYIVPSLELVVVRNGRYRPYGGDAVADPSLLVTYPSDGLIAGRGTVGPDSWDDAAFLGPIVASIR